MWASLTKRNLGSPQDPDPRPAGPPDPGSGPADRLAQRRPVRPNQRATAPVPGQHGADQPPLPG